MTGKKEQGGVLVIGGSGGLGSATVKRLARDWDQMAFTYRSSRDKAQGLADEIKHETAAHLIQMDLTDEPSVEAGIKQAVAGMGGLNALVFASGVEILQPYVSAITSEEWQKSIQVELFGFISVIRHALPFLRDAKGAAIVNIGSFGTTWFPPGDALSAVPKAATEMMCRAIAKEEGRYGIRANTVAPGIIEAGIGKALMGVIYNDEIWESQKKRTPLRRFGAAEDIANAVAYLASRESSFVTGQTIIVDGGLSL